MATCHPRQGRFLRRPLCPGAAGPRRRRASGGSPRGASTAATRRSGSPARRRRPRDVPPGPEDVPPSWAAARPGSCPASGLPARARGAGAVRRATEAGAAPATRVRCPRARSTGRAAASRGSCGSCGTRVGTSQLHPAPLASLGTDGAAQACVPCWTKATEVGAWVSQGKSAIHKQMAKRRRLVNTFLLDHPAQWGAGEEHTEVGGSLLSATLRFCYAKVIAPFL